MFNEFVFSIFLINILQSAAISKKLDQVFTWKQIGYNIDGAVYTKDADYERKADNIYFIQELNDSERFFIQYNSIPIGFEAFEGRVFVTVPRRRHGIPSTLNYVSLTEAGGTSAPLLRPYPGMGRSRPLVSIYRPRVDVCGRLWAVDTGLLEVPGARKQVQPPAIIVFDLKTDQQILRYELKATDLINERTSGGLTSITVDVDRDSCDDAYAYINDLATEGIVVFTLKQRDSWRVTHPSFAHEESALNFTIAGHTITWPDGLFSIALSEADESGRRLAYYHPLMSINEYSIYTDTLKTKGRDFNANFKLVGSRGPSTQSGNHDYHTNTRTLIFANVAQDAILCWNVDTPLVAENVAIVAQSHINLLYISDLKIKDDHVWVLVNQMPRFVFSTLNTTENNFYLLKGTVADLIRHTPCDRSQKSSPLPTRVPQW